MMLLRSPGQLQYASYPELTGIQPNREAGAVVRHVCITAIAYRMYGSNTATLSGKKRILPMWYGSTKNLLESIVRGLRTEAPQNDDAWQAQTELVQVCLAEMVEMSEPPR